MYSGRTGSAGRPDAKKQIKSTLLGKLSDVHAAQTKNDAWRAIAAMISAISNVGRNTSFLGSLRVGSPFLELFF